MMRIKKKKKTDTNKKEKADFAKQTYAVKTIQFVYVRVCVCVHAAAAKEAYRAKSHLSKASSSFHPYLLNIRAIKRLSVKRVLGRVGAL